MSASERAIVSERIRSLRDPVRQLPLELLLRVFDHVARLTTWRLRTVSREWCSVLSGSAFEAAALIRYETHDPSDAATGDNRMSQSVESRLRRLQAVQRDQPFYRADLTGLPMMRTDLSGGYSKAVLKGNFFAYVCGEDRVITILDLLRGRTLHLNGDANETILQVSLTRTTLRFITFNGHMYSSNLSEIDGSCRKTTLPSSALQSIASDEDDVAMLYRQSDYIGYRVILTRGASTIETFDISEMGFASKTMLISAAKQCIDFFGYEPVKAKHAEVMSYQHCRYSYAGEKMSTSSLEDLLGPCESVRNKSATRRSISAPVPTGASAMYQIAVRTPNLGMKSKACRYWTLMSDSDEARLFKHYAGVGASSTEEMPTSRHTRLWKDRYYYPGVNGGIESTPVTMFCDTIGTAKATSRSRDSATFASATGGFPERHVAVNDSFSLCFDNERGVCHIECWDEDAIYQNVVAGEHKGESGQASERWCWTKCTYT